MLIAIGVSVGCLGLIWWASRTWAAEERRLRAAREAQLARMLNAGYQHGLDAMAPADRAWHQAQADEQAARRRRQDQEDEDRRRAQFDDGLLAYVTAAPDPGPSYDGTSFTDTAFDGGSSGGGGSDTTY